MIASPDLCIPIGTSLSDNDTEDVTTRFADYIVQVLDPQANLSRRHMSPQECGPGSSLQRHDALMCGPSTLNDVWLGSGLLSWALDEAGDGKTMIKGKIVRDVEFPLVKSEGSMSVRE